MLSAPHLHGRCTLQARRAAAPQLQGRLQAPCSRCRFVVSSMLSCAAGVKRANARLDPRLLSSDPSVSGNISETCLLFQSIGRNLDRLLFSHASWLPAAAAAAAWPRPSPAGAAATAATAAAARWPASGSGRCRRPRRRVDVDALEGGSMSTPSKDPLFRPGYLHTLPPRCAESRVCPDLVPEGRGDARRRRHARIAPDVPSFHPGPLQSISIGSGANP